MGAYSKFKAAKASGGGYNYFTEGEFELMIMSVKLDETRKKDEMFAVQLRVVETSSQLASMRPGSVVDWVTIEDKDAYAGNVKQFVCACYDLQEQQIDDMTEEEFGEMMELLVGPTQACAGRLVSATARNVLTKAGKPFTAVRWNPSDAQRRADAAAAEAAAAA